VIQPEDLIFFMADGECVEEFPTAGGTPHVDDVATRGVPER